MESCLLRRAASESVGTNPLGSVTGSGSGSGQTSKQTSVYDRRGKAGGGDFVSDFTDFGGDESEEGDISEDTDDEGNKGIRRSNGR